MVHDSRVITVIFLIPDLFTLVSIPLLPISLSLFNRLVDKILEALFYTYKICANRISEILIYTLNNSTTFKQNIWLFKLEMYRRSQLESQNLLCNHINCTEK